MTTCKIKTLIGIKSYKIVCCTRTLALDLSETAMTVKKLYYFMNMRENKL